MSPFKLQRLKRGHAALPRKAAASARSRTSATPGICWRGGGFRDQGLRFRVGFRV